MPPPPSEARRLLLLATILGIAGCAGPQAGSLAIVRPPGPVPEGIRGRPYGPLSLSVGGAPPHTWHVISGRLPGGLTLDPATGAIDGTPTAVGTESDSRCTDAPGSPTV